MVLSRTTSGAAMQSKYFSRGCLVILLSIAGCSMPGKSTGNGTVAGRGARLDGSKAVLIAVPGQESVDGNAASARLMAQQAATAFSRYAKRVDMGPIGAATSDQLIDVARRDGAGYLVLPSITHQEPANAPLPSTAASVNLGVVVIDVSSGQELASINLEGRSRIAPLTPTRRESLVPRLVVDYVESLY